MKVFYRLKKGGGRGMAYKVMAYFKSWRRGVV